jgi:hypothetical protein
VLHLRFVDDGLRGVAFRGEQFGFRGAVQLGGKRLQLLFRIELRIAAQLLDDGVADAGMAQLAVER